MRPRRWWRSAAAADALGRRPLGALVQLGRAALTNGPNLYAVVCWRAGRSPDRDAVIDGHGSLTYRELVAASDGAARWSVANGIDSTPRRVALFCREPRNAVLMVLATQRLGLDVVLLNTLASVAEVDRLVTDRNLVVVSDDPDYGTHLLPGDEPIDADADVPSTARRRRAPTIAILSSGTTGTPTLIDKRPPVGALDTIAAFVEAVGVRSGDRVSLMLPVFHGHGLATVGLSLALGGTLTLRPPADQRADSFRTDWEAIDAAAVDVIVAVPTVLKRLLAAEPARPSTRAGPRAIVSGSAPLDPSTATAIGERFGDVLHNVYGSSEAGVICHAGPDELAIDPSTVGRPLAGVECEIRPGDDGRPGWGEVWVRGGMAGRQWLRTRDLGQLDAAGRLRLGGRVDSMLVIGGEKVAPEALESRIAATPGVAECAVRGIPDDEYGTRVELLVVLEPGATVDELRGVLDESLPRTLRPRSIVAVDRLPRTAVGKLQRRSLADLV